MSTTRTTVLLDDELIKRAKHIAKTDSTTEVITSALTQMVRRDALERLASLLGTDDSPVEVPPRRRPPDFTNSVISKDGK